MVVSYICAYVVVIVASSALLLLAGRQKEHPA